jgi:hypothetical protein
MLKRIRHGGSLCRCTNSCIYPEKFMKLIPVILLFVLSCSVSLKSYSQQFHTTSVKALNAYNDGSESYDYLDYVTAEYYFKQAIAIDNKFYEAYMMMGELMTKLNRYREAAVYYRTAVKLDSLFYRPVFFNLANAEMMSGDYDKALIHFNVYLKQQNISDKNKAQADKNLINCQFALEALKNPVSFNPVSVGEGVNTENDEYWPSITVDGQTLMFTRQGKASDRINNFGSSQEDFYISFFIDGFWQNAINAGSPLNTSHNEGAQTLSSDGSYMYFTACNRPGGLGSCDIFFSSYNNGKWTEPVNLKSPVNTTYWESQPSVSADGKRLFFSSSRPGGIGGKDIWYTVMNNRGQWSEPINLGDKINTDGDEMSPFIHFDGKSLYFSSDGRAGMGGFDIYMSRMQEDSSWTEPRNLGYPINTYNDETGLVIESAGQKAYFSSRRNNITGQDIYYFNLYESARPTPVSYLKGKVFDKETGMLLKASFELINLTTGKIVVSNTTDESGNFIVCLPAGYNYGLNVSKTGYLFYSESFIFEGEHTLIEPLTKQINLNPIRVGEKMLLSNVFYEIDSWQLKKESVIELDKLANLLSENKNLIVEIGGYTDSTGTDDHNLVLSEKRALSVVNYLRDKGISIKRLKYKGYGNTSPIGDNVTSEGRRLNRRTEAKIVDNVK